MKLADGIQVRERVKIEVTEISSEGKEKRAKDRQKKKEEEKEEKKKAVRNNAR